MRSFGTVIQEHAAPAAEALASKAVLDRFRDIVAFTTQSMPQVPLGHCYLIADEEVLTLAEDGAQVIVFAPKTRTIDRISRRAFAEDGSHLGPATTLDLSVPRMAMALAAACEIRVGATEIETIDAICSTIGIEATEHYIEALCSDGGDAVADLYAEGDLDSLLTDAALFAAQMPAPEEVSVE